MCSGQTNKAGQNLEMCAQVMQILDILLAIFLYLTSQSDVYALLRSICCDRQ